MDKAESYRDIDIDMCLCTSYILRYYESTTHQIRNLYGYLTIIETQYVLALVDRCNIEWCVWCRACHLRESIILVISCCFCGHSCNVRKGKSPGGYFE